MAGLESDKKVLFRNLNLSAILNPKPVEAILTRVSRLFLGLISIANLADAATTSVPDTTSPPERSWAASYGPTDQIQFFLTWNGIGLYTQPIIDFNSQSDDNHAYSSRELGVRTGLFTGFTALRYRQLECRLLAGVGGQYVLREKTFESPYSREEYLESKQYAAELWIQPEFRFFSRFAVILQAQTLRYVWEQGDYGEESNRVGFATPELSLSELRVGFRYYLPFGSK